MGLEILKKVEVPKVGMWVCRSLIPGTALECLHLIVNKLAGCNLAPAGNNMEGGVEWSEGCGGNGNAAHDRGTMRTSHAVYGNVVSLLDVELYSVEGACESLTSAWDMAEVALNPFRICRDVEFKSPGAMIGDFRRVFRVSGCREAGNDKFDVRKLRWLSVLLTGA